MKKAILILSLFFSLSAFAREDNSYHKMSLHEREKVFQAISKIDVLIDFYEEDVKKFTREESPENLREYLLSLAAMRVKMKLMMRLPFQLTSNLKELQEMKVSLSKKSLPDLIKIVESGKI